MEDRAVSAENLEPGRSTPTWMNLLLALAAGVAPLLVLQTLSPVFQVDPKYKIEGLGAADEKWTAFLEQQRIVDLKNVALITGIWGGALGIALALMQRTGGALGRRLLGGAILGGLCGLVAGSAGTYLQQYFAAQGQLTLMQSTMVHTLLFGLLGVGLGAISGAFARGGRLIADRAIAGLVAGLIAGIAYPLLASVLFASVNIDATIPSAFSAQLLWVVVGSCLLGWLIPRQASKPRE